MAGDRAICALTVYPYPLTNLTVTAGEGCTFMGTPTFTAGSDSYTTSIDYMYTGDAFVVITADGYQSQTVALVVGGSVSVTLVANLPEIEHIQLGGQTYALRDNRVDDIQATIPITYWETDRDHSSGGEAV